MRILVTGGTGDVGSALVELLVGHGHCVRVIGRRDVGGDYLGAEYRRAAVESPHDMVAVMRGMDAVVHLAALRGPAMADGAELFRVNCAGTVNVYEAAAACGVRRVVTASSINAFGNLFGPAEPPLHYLPLDEEHPTYTTDPYSFSKGVVESIAAYYARRDGISGAVLRIPAVITLQRLADYRAHLRATRAYIADLAALTPTQRQEWVTDLVATANRVRRDRPLERPNGLAAAWDDAERRALWVKRADFFCVIDARDSAQAFERALTADYHGAPPLFVHDSRNTIGWPAAQLAALFYPHAALRLGAMPDDAPLVGIERARAVLAFEPLHHVWED